MESIDIYNSFDMNRTRRIGRNAMPSWVEGLNTLVGNDSINIFTSCIFDTFTLYDFTTI